MYLTFQKGQIFKHIIDNCKDVVDMTIINVNKDGLYINAIDPSHISLINLQLPTSGFKRFDCKEEMRFGVSLKTISAILKCSEKEDTLSIIAKEDSDTLEFRFESEAKSVSIHMKILDIVMDELLVPDMEYECIFSLDSKLFNKICSDLASIGDTCTIQTNNETTFKVSGEIGDAHFTYAFNMMKTHILDMKYSMRYLQLFAKAYHVSNLVTISMIKDQPIKFEYIIENIGTIKYYLAPVLDD